MTSTALIAFGLLVASSGGGGVVARWPGSVARRRGCDRTGDLANIRAWDPSDVASLLPRRSETFQASSFRGPEHRTLSICFVSYFFFVGAALALSWLGSWVCVGGNVERIIGGMMMFGMAGACEIAAE